MTTRRDFIRQASLLTAATLVSPSFLLKSRFKLGLQLFTIREAMAADLKGTLQKIAGFGYEEVEIYGFADAKYYGMAPRAFKQLLDDNNLTTSSGHYDFSQFMKPGSDDAFMKYVDESIEGARILNQEYIVWPWLAEEFRSIDHFKIVAERLNRMGELTKKAGIGVAYHNHDFEFKPQNGKIGYDVILNETDPDLVKIQMDLYWITHSSMLTPRDYFIKYPGRFVSWHIKDMNKTNRNLHEIVGEGSIDFKPILRDAKLAGLQHIFVEQGNNYYGDPLQCVAKSAAFVKKELLK